MLPPRTELGKASRRETFTPGDAELAYIPPRETLNQPLSQPKASAVAGQAAQKHFEQRQQALTPKKRMRSM
jgi:hypothetical protein